MLWARLSLTLLLEASTGLLVSAPSIRLRIQNITQVSQHLITAICCSLLKRNVYSLSRLMAYLVTQCPNHFCLMIIWPHILGFAFWFKECKELNNIVSNRLSISCVRTSLSWFSAFWISSNKWCLQLMVLAAAHSSCRQYQPFTHLCCDVRQFSDRHQRFICSLFGGVHRLRHLKSKLSLCTSANKKKEQSFS